MSRIFYLIIVLCLISWAIGFFLFSLGILVHILLAVAVVIAIWQVLRNK